jgi:hypothetical protein
MTLSACTLQDCILDRSGKNGSNAQNSTSGAMKSVQVQQAGKLFFGFSEALNKFSARLHKTFIPIFQQYSFPLIQPLITFFDSPDILME